MSKFTEFKCPYMNREKAVMAGTMYYCDFDNMEFEEMTAHCSHCEMYEYLLRKAEREIFGGLK
jgi:hypothetical protein